jgi:hypothetical protein
MYIYIDIYVYVYVYIVWALQGRLQSSCVACTLLWFTPPAGSSGAMAQNFEVDTKFTVTVTANGKIVPSVPFVNKGKQGSQMSERFRKVSPP